MAESKLTIFMIEVTWKGQRKMKPIDMILQCSSVARKDFLLWCRYFAQMPKIGPMERVSST